MPRRTHRGGYVAFRPRDHMGRFVPTVGGGRRRAHRGGGFWSDFADGFKTGFTKTFQAAAPIAGLFPQTRELAPVFGAIGGLGVRRRRRRVGGARRRVVRRRRC